MKIMMQMFKLQYFFFEIRNATIFGVSWVISGNVLPHRRTDLIVKYVVGDQCKERYRRIWC